jgi:hexokinase
MKPVVVEGASLDIIKDTDSSLKQFLNNFMSPSKARLSIVFGVGVGLVSVLGITFYRSFKKFYNNSTNNNNKTNDDVDNINISLINEQLRIGLRGLSRKSEDIEKIEKRLDEFKLSDETLTQIMEILESEIERGLNKVTNFEAVLKMLPTYVCQMPTGKENIDVLALDLGGSNFRVLLIRLKENEKPVILNKVFIVSESLMSGSGDKLFNHIANCLFLFIKNHKLDLQKRYYLGFTFSFPCVHTSLSKAVLIRWTKGFNCSDVVGEDVVNLLQQAIDRRGDLNVKVIILINDTVGTLVSSAYT